MFYKQGRLKVMGHTFSLSDCVQSGIHNIEHSKRLSKFSKKTEENLSYCISVEHALTPNKGELLSSNRPLNEQESTGSKMNFSSHIPDHDNLQTVNFS